MSRRLPYGVYEHLITRDLEASLAALTAPYDTRHLDDSDAPRALAAHVGSELKRALAALPQHERGERARAITDQILALVASLLEGEAAQSVQAQTVASPVRQLLAIHRGAAPDRPSSPLSTSTLLTRGPSEPALARELAREIATADRVDVIVAFITVSGVRALQAAFETFALREDTRLRVLTTTFSGITEVAALDMLSRLPRASVKVSYDTRRTRLHAKAWLFHRQTGLSTAYIGSANLTSTALGSGHEWMVKVCAADVPHVIDRFVGTFDTLWEDPEFEPYTHDNVEQRARLTSALSSASGNSTDGSAFLVTLRPHPFQAEILDKLDTERHIHGRFRNLVVAATGTGKTVVAALDYARRAARAGVNPRLLFLAHRKELLDQAQRTFRYALQDASFGELLVGKDEPTRFDHVFASVQSAASTDLLGRLGADYFEHVVIDECHHVPAATYQSIVSRLRPGVLVGLTATPERADGKSLLPDFDDHIAAELRLWHALEDQLLVPFEYFGISDGVDLRAVRWARTGYDLGHLGDIYSGHHARARLVAHQLHRRVSDVRKVRALGFCVSVAHADFMAVQFTELGIPAMSVHGSSTEAERRAAPQRLRDRAINVIFTCDLYNEGVDLPFVDTLLLLRPTQSATLFLQQLGRGLRHTPGKSSCLVLDFIGQHRDEFRFDSVLGALTGVPRGQLRKAIEDDFPYLPSGCTLSLDRVARDEILRSIRATTGGAQKLALELRELTAGGARPTLVEFLTATGREVGDVYEAGGWTTLRRRAGLLDVEDAATEVSRKLMHILHVDEPERLATYCNAIEAASRGEPIALTTIQRRHFHMLAYQLHHRGVIQTAEETIAQLVRHRALVEELQQLRPILANQAQVAHQIYPVPQWSLALHRHYQRREIVAAVGYVEPGDKGVNLQTGILTLEGRQQLLFVTLDKSGSEFSPSTRYRDYAISPQLFHWETQSAASSARPSGKRYTESSTNGWRFYLFVRASPETPFSFLGPVQYEGHAGDRPIGITWRLATPMPAVLFERYATLRSG